MLLCALRARYLPVRNVSNERMLERELRLAVDRATSRALYQLLLSERVQLLLCRPERSEPKHFADHRSVLDQRLLVRRQRIEPRRDDALDGLRQRQLFCRSTFGEHAHELLGVERISAGTFE